MHSDQKQPEFKISDLNVLGCGSFNVAFKYIDKTYNKQWVIKVSKKNNVTDTPERSVFLWNLFHPQNKAKLCKVDDRQAWMCPFFVENIDCNADEKSQPLLLNSREDYKRQAAEYNKQLAEDEKLADLIIRFYKQTQRIVLDIAVSGNIIGDKLVDVGFAFFAPSKKGRERRGSVASAEANNNNVQKDFKFRYSGPTKKNVLHALVAIARQLADTPENKAFKANFSTVDDNIFDNDLFNKYKGQLEEISPDSKASVFKYTENSLSKKILTFVKYLLLLTLVGLLIYDLCVSNLVISYLIKHYAVSFTLALIINSTIIALLLCFIINPLFSFIKQKISIILSEDVFKNKTYHDLREHIYINTVAKDKYYSKEDKQLSEKYKLSVNKGVLKIDSKGDDVVPIIYFAGADQTAENAYNAYKVMLDSDVDNKFDLYFQNMPGLVDGTQLKITNDINAKYNLVLKIASMKKYQSENICLYGYSLGGTVALAVAEKLKYSRPNIYKRLKIVTIDSPISTSSVVEDFINDKGSKKFKIKTLFKTLFCLIFASLLFLAYFLSPIYALYVSNMVACIICMVTTVTIDYFYDLFVNFFIRPLMSVAGCDVSVKSITKELFKNNKLFCVFADGYKNTVSSIYHAIDQSKNDNVYFSNYCHRFVDERYPPAAGYNCKKLKKEGYENFRQESDEKIKAFLSVS